MRMKGEVIQLFYSHRVPLPASSPESFSDSLPLRDSPFPGREEDSPLVCQ